MPRQRKDPLDKPRPTLRALRRKIEERSHRDEATARSYLTHAADRANIITGKERVVIDLSNLVANTNRFAVIQYIGHLAAEYGLVAAKKPTDTNPNKLYFKKSTAS